MKRLPIHALDPGGGSPGEVATISPDGTFIEFAAASGGGGGSSDGPVSISEQVLSIAASTFTVNGIPSTYRALEVILEGRTNKAAVNSEVWLYLNGDTTPGNYRYQRVGGLSSGVYADSGSLPIVGWVNGATAPAGESGTLRVRIPNYARTTWHKTATSESWTPNVPYLTHFGYRWANAASVISLTLLASGAEFQPGSILQVYGVV